MHCKFWCFCLLFSFSFFSNACEFQLIERIGAHGKQNPDFIIYYYYYNLYRTELFISLMVTRTMKNL